MTVRLSQEALDTLFYKARTAYAFESTPVSAEEIEKIHELTFLAPTGFNNQPLRISWLVSDESRQRLMPYLNEGNRENSATAPVIAILSFDRNWQKHFERFAPHAAHMEKIFEPESVRMGYGRLNATVMAGFFIAAVRAVGLDAGPMTGSAWDGIEAEFLEGLDQEPFLVVNVGHGLPAARERGFRFAFEEGSRVL
ncbi:MAG: malonic semialdehyde reductase [Rothia sp. (in: high G+C Gram-positive bacteria)]|uniref:malonic semialdehyde reductase n=1 Tax=Rothia sp. (in: high G+C Gram-positive bacteria) TaxID=1885016 RepID=UPI0026E02ECE|nr:malonic semialdehyde reductase [Rothia sp. (in: high G+C Gram-positive bacteria)]MDO5750565.1 malonic semialdehyde reductase [Rothia sp. (in: high G+C Gram-positive bacteria)]